MKKTLSALTLASSLLLCTSCMSIFTSAKQTITFMGEEGTQLYDATNNMKIGEITEDGTASVRLRKRLSDKTIIARKEGYKNTPVVIEPQFNPCSLWNILFWPGFLVDLGTEKMFKWDNCIVQIEMEADTTSPNEPERPSQE